MKAAKLIDVYKRQLLMCIIRSASNAVYSSVSPRSFFTEVRDVYKRQFYQSREWRQFLDRIIVRDAGCDLACKDHEITHNGDKGETYLDAYKKWDNQCIVD